MANQDKILVARKRAQFVFRRKFGDLSPVAVAGRMPENVKSEIFWGRGNLSKREAHVVNVAPCQKLRAEPSYWERLSGKLWNATFRTTLGLPRGQREKEGEEEQRAPYRALQGCRIRCVCEWEYSLVCVCVWACAHSLGLAWSSFVTQSRTHTHIQSFIYNLTPRAICFYFAL